MSNKIKISILSATKPHIYKGKNDGIIAVAQMKKYWENQLQQAVNDKSDIVLLPEACDRFSNLENRFKKEYESVKQVQMPKFFQTYAKEHNINIIYSSINKNKNSMFLYNRDGILKGRYDKVFPTIWEIEEGIIPGRSANIFSIDKIGKAGFAICYDLNFDELRQQYIKFEPEIIFFSSMFHGGFQQNIWSYSTKAFFISAVFGEQSRIIAPNGRVIASTSNYNNHCSGIVNIDSKLIHIDYNIEKFKAIKKKYKDKVIIDDTGYLGSVMMYNESDDCTIDDICDEFDIELLDVYFDRSRKKRDDIIKNI